MKKLYLPVLLVTCLLIAACGDTDKIKENDASTSGTVETETSNGSVTDVTTEASEDNDDSELSDNDKIYDFAIECWKKRDVAPLYEYCSKDIKDLIDEDGFVKMFDRFVDTFGAITSVDEKDVVEAQGMQSYCTTVHFENADCPASFTFINGELGGISMLPTFTKDFTKEVSDTVKEDYFQIDSDGYKLTAVFTYSGSDAQPTVLLINGSGPSDYNEATGLVAPFEEIARQLADKGINSLRMEKRTYRFGDKFKPTDDLDEEYFTDFGNAYKWLQNDSRVSDIYIVGHSLGAQIALEMSDEYKPAGLVFLNGTMRHLADVAYDQYVEADPANKAAYTQMFSAAKAVTAANVSGANYGGLTDYYWADYNDMDLEGDMKAVDIPVTIINCGADSQIYDADIDLFKTLIEGKDNCTFTLLPGINHFGYKSEGQNAYDTFKNREFATEIIDAIAAGIKK
ncbi:MAG: alpha/beta hydrolase [Lachnospiraceae bacterium]|nr:alpha/beta hydrolase [Lachnospiraceae bacterium]